MKIQELVKKIFLQPMVWEPVGNTAAMRDYTAHCCNNFMKALEALKIEHEWRVEMDVDGNGDLRDHYADRCDVCKLIAELEEVKE